MDGATKRFQAFGGDFPVFSGFGRAGKGKGKNKPLFLKVLSGNSGFSDLSIYLIR
mgnify:CR=1 FL=1